MRLAMWFSVGETIADDENVPFSVAITPTTTAIVVNRTHNYADVLFAGHDALLYAQKWNDFVQEEPGFVVDDPLGFLRRFVVQETGKE